jgi:hypothetical protein
LGQIPLARAGFRQRPGFRVRQAGINHETGAGQLLQGRHSLLATSIASKSVVEATGQEVHLACLRSAGPGRENANAGRQRRG